MIFQIQRSRKTTETLNDLLRIHTDRIKVYQQVLEQFTIIDSDLQEVFERIIFESECYQQQLLHKIKGLNGNAKTYAPLFGKIYRAWIDLKVAFSGITQKAIITSCLYNEEITLHAYRAALNTSTEMTDDIRELIEKQENELKEVYNKIKKYRDTRHAVDYRMLYFT